MKIKYVIMAVLLFASALLAGCSAGELELVTALASQPRLTSYESDSTISMSLRVDENPNYVPNSYSYSDANFSYILRMLGSVIDGAGYDITAKYSSNADYSQVRQEMVLTPVFLGGSLKDLSFGVWSDYDKTSGDWVNSTYQVPKVISSMIPGNAMRNKDYVTYSTSDIKELYEAMDAPESVTGLFDNMPDDIMNDSLEYADFFFDSFVTIAENLDTKTAYIESAEETEDGGRLFRVKITDKGLKDLLRTFVNMDEVEFKALAREFYTETIKLMAALGYEEEPPFNELPTAAELFEGSNNPFDTWYDGFVESANKLLDAANKMKLLGGDGITLDITLNEDGFLSALTVKSDIVIDMRGAAVAEGRRYTDEVNKIHIGIDIDTTLNKINEEVVVEMPKLTSRNSISAIELYQSLGSGVYSSGGGSSGGAGGGPVYGETLPYYD